MRNCSHKPRGCLLRDSDHVVENQMRLLAHQPVMLELAREEGEHDSVSAGPEFSEAFLADLLGDPERRVAIGELFGRKERRRQRQLRADALHEPVEVMRVTRRTGHHVHETVPRRELGNETLMGVLNGEILVQNHCYRADEMANTIAMSNEFGYKVTTFHHAVESYKIADLLVGLRVAEEAEREGLDITSHGETAYSR